MEKLEEEKVFPPPDTSKRDELLKDFAESGWSADREIMLNELLDHIETRMRYLSGKEEYKLLPEEEDAIEKLFASTDKNEDGYVSISSFVDSLLEHQLFCKSRQSLLQSRIHEINDEVSEFILQKETQEAHRDSFNKFVKVEVIEANELPEQQAHYVIVHFENQTSKTKSMIGPSPVWNELFTFSVYDPKNKINVAVWSENPGKTDSFQGICVNELPEEQQNEQEKITEWKNLVDEEGKTTSAKLKLGVQYLFNPLQIIDVKIQEKEIEKGKVREELNQIIEFGKKASGN